MKRKLLFRVFPIIMLFLALSAGAQERQFENHVQIGSGPFYEAGKDITDVGLTISFSYGLDIRLSEGWSVMPTIGYRGMVEQITKGMMEGADPDVFEFLDLGVSIRCHSFVNETGFILGLAPVVALTLSPDQYYIDAGPDPLGGKDKIKSCDFGVRPGLSIPVGKHWEFGIETYISLINMEKRYSQYRDYHGSIFIRNTMLTAAYCF